jgi:hypothetical protein
MHTITIVEVTLSDDSKVYNVNLVSDDHSITFQAVTEDDAKELVWKIADAVEAHTNDTIRVL